MVILVLGARPDVDLEVRRSFGENWNLKVFEKSNREWTF